MGYYIKQDLKNNIKITLIKGCNEPSTIGDGCYYSKPILLDNNRTLYYLKDQWMTSNGIYKLDLVTLENKFITDGNSFQVINEGKYKNYLIINKHKYMGKGDSFDYHYLVSPEGKQITTITNPESFSYYKSKVLKTNIDLNNLIEIFLYEWDKAHNNKNLNTFNLIYNENINYYNSRNINKSIAIKDKKELLKKFSNFYQTSSLLKIVNLGKNIYKLNYEKHVIYGENIKTFSSYLIIKIVKCFERST